MSGQGKMVGLEELAQALKAADDYVICGHVSPDGDCIGSQLAMAAALRALGKKAVCLLARDEELDYSLSLVPGADEMLPACKFTGSYRSFLSVDVPNADRMGQDAKALHQRAENTITIDHHIPNGPMSQVNYVDADAPAAALMVWRLLPYLGVAPTPEIATNCYLGLNTDCGRFSYQNATSEAFHAAAEMVDAGANPAQVANWMYQNRSRASVALEKRVIEHMEFLAGGAGCISYLKRSDFVETNATKADAEPMIDLLRSLRGVRVACMLREQEGQVRGSLRAKDETDVSLIANEFGGGGHKAAAGFTFEGGLQAARKVLAEKIAAVL